MVLVRAELRLHDVEPEVLEVGVEAIEVARREPMIGIDHRDQIVTCGIDPALAIESQVRLR